MSHWFYVTPEEYLEAERIGISRDRVNQRVRKSGWSVKKAITTPIYKSGRKCKYRKLAEQNGISQDLYSKRLKNGWTKIKAATKPVRKQNTHDKGIIQEAERNGISYSTFLARVNKHGWTPAKAATTPLIIPGSWISSSAHPWKIGNRLFFVSRQEKKYVMNGQRY